MQLQWNSLPCTYLRRSQAQVHNQEQTQEVRLPEGMPDMGRILCAWGQPVLRSKEWRNDSIAATGGIITWVLYLPEDGSQPRSMEAWIPFQAKWDRPEGGREGTIHLTCQLQDLEGRMLSGRKMMIRANVALQMHSLQSAQLEVPILQQESEDVQLLRKTYPLCLRKEAGEKPFLLQEQLQLTGAVPSKILGCEARCAVAEQSAVGNKLVVRGNCRVHLVYMDREDRVCGRWVNVPFSQFTDLDADYDKEARAMVSLAFTSLEPELLEGHVQIKCGMIAQYEICDRQLIQVAEDAYSPGRTLVPDLRLIPVDSVLDSGERTLELTGQLQEHPGQIVDLSLLLDQPTQYREGDQAYIELPGALQALYYDAEDQLRAECVPVNGRLQLPLADNAHMSLQLTDAQLPEQWMGRDLGCSCRLETITTAEQEIPMLWGMELGEAKQPDPQRPALVLRRAGQATLWELAKHYGSTVDAIRNANQLEANQEPEYAQMLLIPIH